MSRLLLYSLASIVSVGCAGQQGPAEPSGARPAQNEVPLENEPVQRDSDRTSAPQTRVETPRMAHGPDGEMIPSVFRNGEGAARSDSGARLPTERIGLMKSARDALTSGRIDEAVAIADTLVIIHPGDAEVLELRATVLTTKGDTEQAGRDLTRCCALGRASCCRDQDADQDASD